MTQPSRSPWPGSCGFVGGVVDDTGLTHLGAREYDPGLGRFISLDPVMDLTDPQQLHGYAYANNNPTTFSDPTGLLPWKKNPSASQPKKNNNHNAGPTKNTGFGGKGTGGSHSGFGRGGGGGSTTLTQASYGASDDSDDERAPSGGFGAYNPFRPLQEFSEGLNPFSWGRRILDFALPDVESAVKCARAPGVNGNCGSAVLEFAPWGRVLNKVKDAVRVLSDLRRGCNSFLPETQVVMADGTTKPIEDVEIGDEVLATDPETGETTARTVTAEIVGTGEKDLVTLSIATEQGRASTITATEGHPFWVPELDTWIEAGQLAAGIWLQTHTGARVQIVAVSYGVATATVRNLTVEGVHTYYAIAGEAPVLVHNAGNCSVDGVPHGVIGEAATLDRLQREGYSNIVPEVRFRNSQGDVFRADFVARHPDGGWVAVEVKTGSGATVSPNQSVGYPELTDSGAVLDTSRLSDFGLEQGDRVRMRLEIDVWECGTCSP
ncbi:polymorphic toxin-type HINT domain-containing protein [Streptomyces mayteni]